MCGIIGYTGQQEAAPILMEGLSLIPFPTTPAVETLTGSVLPATRSRTKIPLVELNAT